MATIITYTINSGTPNFTAKLNPELVEPNVHTEFGTYSFENVPNGTYTLIVTDSNGCTFEKQLIVNPTITTTITTQPPDDSIIVGCTQTTLVIFNEDLTNTNNSQQLSTNTYLWFKTTDDNILNKTIVINYEFKGTDHNFNFIDVSDDLNFIVSEIVSSGNNIKGQIILLPNFIESYFLYNYVIDSSSGTNYNIELIPSSNTNTPYKTLEIDDSNNEFDGTYVETEDFYYINSSRIITIGGERKAFIRSDGTYSWVYNDGYSGLFGWFIVDGDIRNFVNQQPPNVIHNREPYYININWENENTPYDNGSVLTITDVDYTNSIDVFNIKIPTRTNSGITYTNGIRTLQKDYAVLTYNNEIS